MSKIKFFGLGGLGENGKNLYVCEVDESIFILDAGLKYPSVDLLGIDSIYPSLEYLEENSERIKGIFLSHGHEENIGAVVEVIKRFNISVFGTHFTISLVEKTIEEQGLVKEHYRLYRINEDKKLKFGKVSVEFYNVSHSIPEAINIAIITPDGAIVYAPDFSFDVNSDKKYHISFGRINDIAKYGVLALASESLGTSNLNRTNNNYELDYYVTNTLKKKGRCFFTIYSYDLEKIQRVINLALNMGRRIALIGIKTQRIVNIATQTGYLKVHEDKLVTLKFRNEKITNEDDDLAIIVTGARHEPFFMMQRMCNGQDRLLQVKKGDNLLMLTPPITGCERIQSRMLANVLESGVIVTDVNKDAIRSTHASPENLKMLYGMLNPKYIIPIIGEYRHQYMQKNIAIEVGYKNEDIILLDNGQVAYFENGVLKDTKEKVKCGDVLVDGSIIGDINEVVLKDRELMSEEGIIFVTTVIDTKHRSLLGGPEIVSKGFSISDENKLFSELKELVTNEMYLYLNKRNLDLSKANEYLRKKLNDYLTNNYSKHPIIIPSFIDIK